MDRPAAPSEASVAITIKIPGTLAESLRTYAKSSGQTIGSIVAGALKRFFEDPGRHG